MTLDNDNVHFLVRAKKILRTNELLPILNHFYNQKTQAFMDNNYEMVSDYINWGHLIANATDYEQYRQSHHWKDLRTRTLDKYKNCIVCSRPSEDIHHNKYHGVLFREQVGVDVVAMCRNCHTKFHNDNKVANYYELKRTN